MMTSQERSACWRSLASKQIINSDAAASCREYQANRDRDGLVTDAS